MPVDLNWDGFKSGTIPANRYQQMFVNGYLDVSGRTIIRNGDLSLNDGRLFVQGDTSLNGNLFVNKNVGIGKSVAAYTLDVLGNASITGNVVFGYDTNLNGNITIGKDITVLGRLNVQNFTTQNIINTTTNNYQLIVSEDLSLNGRLYARGNVMIGSGNEASYLLDVSSASSQPFRVGVGATNALVINSQGNVGIGTTNPNFPLNINGPENGVTLTCNFPATASAGNPSTTAIRVSSSGYGFQIDGGLLQGSYSYGALSTVNNGTVSEKLRITSAGLVGIGITNPAVALDVSGMILVNSLGGTVGTAGISNGGSKSSCGYFPFYSWNGTRMGYIGNCPTSTSTGLGTGTMYIQAESGCTGWNFSNGNVGIGSATPAVALDVVGNTKLGANSKSISCIQFGTSNVAGTSTGTITFTSAFPTTPIVVASIIATGSDMLTIMISGVSTTGFTYTKSYITPSTGRGDYAPSQNFYWIAISN